MAPHMVAICDRGRTMRSGSAGAVRIRASFHMSLSVVAADKTVQSLLFVLDILEPASRAGRHSRNQTIMRPMEKLAGYMDSTYETRQAHDFWSLPAAFALPLSLSPFIGAGATEAISTVTGIQGANENESGHPRVGPVSLSLPLALPLAPSLRA